MKLRKRGKVEFELDQASEQVFSEYFLNGQEIAVPTAVLINTQCQSFSGGEGDQFIGFFYRLGKRFFYNDMFSGFKCATGIFIMGIVGSVDYDQFQAVHFQQFVEAADDAGLRIPFAGQVFASFGDSRQFEMRIRADKRGMKYLS